MASLFKFEKVNNYIHVKFTPEGLKEFGPLFVCESLVQRHDSVNKKTKLLCVEGMNMLSCIKYPFNEGIVYHVTKFQCPSEITTDTPLITITTKDTDALQSL